MKKTPVCEKEKEPGKDALVAGQWHVGVSRTCSLSLVAGKLGNVIVLLPIKLDGQDNNACASLKSFGLQFIMHHTQIAWHLRSCHELLVFFLFLFFWE